MVFVNGCGKDTAELFPYLKWLIFKNLIYIWVPLTYSVISFCSPTKWFRNTFFVILVIVWLDVDLFGFILFETLDVCLDLDVYFIP